MVTEKQEQREVKQDRSMARLAEILKAEGTAGVFRYEERECCRPPRLYFLPKMSLAELEDLIEASGYQMVRFLEAREYDEEKTGMPWSYDIIEFAVSEQ